MQDMANTLRSSNVLSLANRITKNSNAYPNLTVDHYSQLRQQELTMELTQKLQATLEIEEMITLLLQQLCKLVTIDGITYEFANLDYECSTPVQGKHKASYQLDMGKEDLGLISFSRRIRWGLRTVLPAYFGWLTKRGRTMCRCSDGLVICGWS